MSAKNIQTQASCSDKTDPILLSVRDAQQQILCSVESITGFEKLAIRNTLGRIVVQPVISPINVPNHTNSAMDGYAVRASDLPTEGVRKFSVIGTSSAGKPFTGHAKENQAVRIMTGAVMPMELDTVVIQEHVEREGDTIRVGEGHKVGQNVRLAGEDLTQGQVVLPVGKKIAPAELGLLASLGIAEVKVSRRLRVAFFSTGDELRTVGTPLEQGQIYDSNRYTLYGMLSRLGTEIIDMGIVPDNRATLQQVLREAAEVADVVITSGGVSVGEADYTKEVLEQLGTIKFWKIAMKPGRPLTFGNINDTTFFGLPGNPVSVMVTFYQFVQPALQRMMGMDIDINSNISFRVPCACALRKGSNRMEIIRGILMRDENGNLVVTTTGNQGSGILNSMSRANCFILLPPESQQIEAGACVEVQPFDGLV